jgi:hypothetical protein
MVRALQDGTSKYATHQPAQRSPLIDALEAVYREGSDRNGLGGAMTDRAVTAPPLDGYAPAAFFAAFSAAS